MLSFRASPAAGSQCLPQQTELPGWLSGSQQGPQLSKDFPQSCPKLFPVACSLCFQSPASLSGRRSPLSRMPDPILYSPPLCVGARDPDAGKITQNKSQPGPKIVKIIDHGGRERERTGLKNISVFGGSGFKDLQKIPSSSLSPSPD